MTLARQGRLQALKPDTERLTTPAQVEAFARRRKKSGADWADIQLEE